MLTRESPSTSTNHSPEVRSLRIIHQMKIIKLIKNPPDCLAVVMLTVGIVAYLIGLGVLRNFIHS